MDKFPLKINVKDSFICFFNKFCRRFLSKEVEKTLQSVSVVNDTLVWGNSDFSVNFQVDTCSYLTCFLFLSFLTLNPDSFLSSLLPYPLQFPLVFALTPHFLSPSLLHFSNTLLPSPKTYSCLLSSALNISILYEMDRRTHFAFFTCTAHHPCTR